MSAAPGHSQASAHRSPQGEGPPVSATWAPQAPHLLRERALIAGAWTAADDGQTLDVHDPASGETLASVPRMGGAETRRAIAAAQAALTGWRSRTAGERACILRRWADLMLAHRSDLAHIMSREQGKPLAEADGEIAYAASFIEWFGEEAKRVDGEVLQAQRPGQRMLVLRQPVGVCAAITPWNFPAAMITRKVGPALAAGCTIVVKPAELTPLTALALGVLAEEAGVPPGRAPVRDRRPAGHRRRAVRKRCGAQAQFHRLHRGRPAPDGAVRADHQEARSNSAATRR